MTLPGAGVTASEYWKYGPTPDNALAHWYSIPVSVVGNVATFTIVDGGLGDDDLTANGTIVDVAGPAIAGSQAIPALSDWGLRLLLLLMMCGAWYAARRRLG